MNATPRNVVWSVVLIVVGLLFLAYNLGYLRFAELKDFIGTWWPLVLIAVGVGNLIQRRSK